jgi:hypothetical protein
MPKFLGAFDEGDVTLIVLEDLSDAEWPPPWSPRGIDAVLASLDALRRTTPPQGLHTSKRCVLRSSAGPTSPRILGRC